MATAVELKQERARLWERMKEINDTAERANRDLDAEERSNWDKADADIRSLSERITRAEALERKPMTEPEAQRSNVATLDRFKGATAEEIRQSPEFKAAFRSWVIAGDRGMDMEERQLLGMVTAKAVPEMRAMGISTAATGGTFAPPDFVRSVDQAMLAFGGILQVATPINTADGSDLTFPTSNDTGNTGELVAEHGTISTLDVPTGAVILKSFAFSSKLVRVSYQLLQDSAFDIEGWLSAVMGERLGRITNTYCTVGVGANQPQGIVTGATLGKTGAAVGDVTMNETIDLIHSVDPAYRVGAGAGFMFNDTTLSYYRKMVDGNGNYLWQPGTVSGEPDRLMGYRYTVNQDMANLGTTAKPILFGQLSKYHVRRVAGLQMIRLDEAYATQLQVGFFAYLRLDGGLIDSGTHPVKYFQNA